jgi:cellulose biosynthesis protein BcsQ
MKTLAVYSLKGGVGKTTLAVNLAWAAATLSSRKTLLWDLDPQGAATFMLDAKVRRARDGAQAAFARKTAPTGLVRPTGVERLSLIAADRSLRDLNHFLHELDKKARLAKLLAEVAEDFDRTILDCPPGFNETTDQILRASDLILVPVIPSPLAQRALLDLQQELDKRHIAQDRILPVFNLVDRRRSLHRGAVAASPEWPVIPMASAFETMSIGGRPVGALRPGSPAATGLADLWRKAETRLIAKAR